MKLMNRNVLFLAVMTALILSFFNVLSFADTFTAKVVAISSGDTIKVLLSGRVIAIRLKGIDSPNKNQAYSEEAKRFIEDNAYGKKVTVVGGDVDRRGQTLAKVILPSGKSLNKELIKAGLAWWNLRNSRDQVLGKLEKEARKKELGLWQDSMPLPPWEYMDRKVAMRR